MKAFKVETANFEKTKNLLGDLLGKIIKAFIIKNGLIIFPEDEIKENEMNQLVAKYDLKPIAVEAPTKYNSGWHLRYWMGQDCLFSHFIKLEKIPCDISLRNEALAEAILIWDLNPDEHPVRKDPELIFKEDLAELGIGLHQ